MFVDDVMIARALHVLGVVLWIGMGIASLQGDAKEETQGRDRQIHRRRRGALCPHMMLEATKVLLIRLVRRAAQKNREVSHSRDVSSLGAGVEVADFHVALNSRGPCVGATG